MSTSDVDTDRAAVSRATAELLAAVNSSDADGCARLWATDAVLMPPHHPAVEGRQAIFEYFRNLFSRSKLEFVFTSSRIHLAGNTAVEILAYTATIWRKDDASMSEDAGKGLHVYTRQADGTWKLAYDIWNSDRSAPGR